MGQIHHWTHRLQFFLFSLFVIGLTFSISLWEYSLLGAVFFTFIRIIRESEQRRLVTSHASLAIVVGLYVVWTLIAALATQHDKSLFAGVTEEWLFLAIPVVWSTFAGLSAKSRNWLLTTLGVTIIVITLCSFVSQLIGYNILRPSDLDSLKIGRCSGAFSHPLTYAEVMLGLGSMMLAYAMYEKVPLRQPFYQRVFFCVSLGVISSGSRAGLTFLFLGTILVVLVRWKMLTFRTRTLAIIPVFVIMASLMLNPKLMYRGSNDVETQSQIQKYGKRSFIWSTSWEIALQYPLFGVGPDGFAKEYDRHLPPDVLKPLHFSHAHNDVLNMTATRGMLGGVFYLAIWGVIFLRIGKQWKQDNLLSSEFHTVRFGAAIGLVALFACGMTESTFVDEEVRGVLMLLVGLLYLPFMNEQEPRADASEVVV